MEEIYKEIILDHYKNPRNFGKIKKPDFYSKESNVFCGDDVEFFLKIKNKRIKEIKFQGRGCVISQASSSLLSEYLKNKLLSKVKETTINDVINLLGIKLSPTRMKCAELPLIALKKINEER